MIQKITWMHFSIFGISAIALMVLISCGKGEIEYKTTTNFIYKNLTSEDVEIILYDKEDTKFQTYSIATNKEVEVVITGDGPKTGINRPFRLRDDVRYIATKVTIKFITSNKCLSFSSEEGLLNVKQYDNFSESMYNASNNTLIYNIDIVELTSAVICN